MANRPEKQNRKEALDRWKSEQRAAASKKLPLPNAELRSLFDYLDAELPVRGCDHSHRICLDWISQRSAPPEELLNWLRENGGYCDCEALANAEPNWKDAVHDVDWDEFSH